jgi:peptide chain release factor 1
VDAQAIVAEYAELVTRLADPALPPDDPGTRQLRRRRAALDALYPVAVDVQRLREDRTAARELALATEAHLLTDRLATTERRLAELVADHDPYGPCDVVIRIRASALAAPLAELIRERWIKNATHDGYLVEPLDGEPEHGHRYWSTIAITAPDHHLGLWGRWKSQTGLHTGRLTSGEGVMAEVVVLPDDDNPPELPAGELRVEPLEAPPARVRVQVMHPDTGTVAYGEAATREHAERNALRVIHAHLLCSVVAPGKCQVLPNAP